MTNLDAFDNHGQTPLHIAQIHGHVDIMNLLVQAGARVIPMLPCLVDNCNNECRTPHNCKEVHPYNA